VKNERISAKERGLIKGAIRRVFSRSDLRRSILEAGKVDYFDPNRPRVKKWTRCSACGKLTPTYLAEVDHTDPIIPVDRSLESMTWDEIIDRVFCSPNNLAILDKICHKLKTASENAERRKIKKESKK
jgi:hypothetical protein